MKSNIILSVSFAESPEGFLITHITQVSISMCYTILLVFCKNIVDYPTNAEEQIISNGKGEITITTKETEDKNLLIIQDTAGGASPEVVESIFKEFFTTKKEGFGIGLFFCKKMMQNFGGDLTCHSVFGESMSFILSFPKIVTTK